jgi:hypothetical protein
VTDSSLAFTAKIRTGDEIRAIEIPRYVLIVSTDSRPR